MSAEPSFTMQLRRRAIRSDVIGNLWMCAISLALVPYGLYFILGKCSDCTGLNVGGIIIGLGMEAVAAWLAWWMVTGVRDRMKPGGDALSVQLKPYGDPAALLPELDAEFSGQAFKKKRLYVGKRWLVFTSSEPMIRRRDDMVWAYVEAVRIRLNGIIPIRTEHYLHVWEKSGRGAAMEMKKEEAEGALAALADAQPWLLVGYTEALKESWNSDREDLLAHVAKRKTGG